MKFEKARLSLQESLRRVVEIVTEHICNQVYKVIVFLVGFFTNCTQYLC